MKTGSRLDGRLASRRDRGVLAFTRERHPAYKPPRQVVPGNPNSLRLSWFVYRGSGRVIFDPVQTKVWQDTRPYANSSWSPPFEIPPVPLDGKWEVQATFDGFGTYVLRAVASDGALFTAEDMIVTVTL